MHNYTFNILKGAITKVHFLPKKAELLFCLIFFLKSILQTTSYQLITKLCLFSLR